MNRINLDREYSPSSMIDDIQVYLKAYAQRSAEARAACTSARFKLSYGDAPRQYLDYFPTANEKAPLFIFIHGGYWQQLSSADHHFHAAAVTAAGINLATVNYRLCPEVSMTTLAQDLRTALLWLKENSGALGYDPKRVLLGGHSAGAHLTALMMCEDWGNSAPFHAALPLSGIFDLEPIRLSYVNEPLGMNQEEALRLSPIFQTPKVKCPTLVAVAERDTAEFNRQSTSLFEHWRSSLPECSYLQQAGLHHFDSPFDWCNPSSDLFRYTVALAHHLNLKIDRL